ncbi:MAG: trehalose-phosphatase [bacterium]
MAELKNRQINLENIDAFILDMDGVVTKTARVHAAVWKQMFDEYLKERASRMDQDFKPFDIEADYLPYVDGKPRYDGVKSFLESRNISISYGNPSDPPEKKTVCGLGNRKNRYFLDHLKKYGAESYSSTVDFIHKAKSEGFRFALISASKNVKEVLEATDLQDIFDVTVDGIDAAELALKGKPEPDIFLEAARRLDVRPERAVVIEDALAGVEAGKAGGFALVMGIDRGNQRPELMKHGADIVVKDVSDIQLKKKKMTVRMPGLPSALGKQDEIFQYLKEGVPAIFLDYDGTLTPIVQHPSDAIMPEKTREVIKSLAEHWMVAIISGRDLNDVRKMVGLDNIVYAGSHGFDISGPGDTLRGQKLGEEFLPALDQAESELETAIKGIRGAFVERKRFAIAVHFRMADEKDIPGIEEKVDDIVKLHSELRKSTGKKIFELRPNMDWDKGKALLSLLEKMHINSSRVVPLYIGDDTTDEDAFRAIADLGVGILVSEDNQQTYARYVMKNTSEVASFLEMLLDLAEKDVSKGIWTLAYEGFDPEGEGLRETLCTLGNGYFATRGAAPESKPDDVHYPGTYIGGCYNRLESKVAGKTIENESIVNIPNWLPLTFRIDDGDWFDIQDVDIQEYHQELDMRRGVLNRTIRFTDKKGRQTRLFQRRFAHMGSHHLAGLETTIIPENWHGTLYVRSALEGRVENSQVKRYQKLNNKHLKQIGNGVTGNEVIWLQVETNRSHIRIALAARTRAFQGDRFVDVERHTNMERGYICQDLNISAKEGEPVRIEKIVAIYNSKDRAISESLIGAREEVAWAANFIDLLKSHIHSWEHLWERCQISVESDGRRMAQILNLHIFHLIQTVSVHSLDLDIGVPPRGLHGEAYRGLIMWDDMFIFPFLNLRIPDITRGLLRYRYRRLPKARRVAKLIGYEGAMFPWQSGSDGREEAQKLHLNPQSGRWIPDNSNLQRHINIAVAYNVWNYYQVTSDMDFMCFYGAEIILEIARFWVSLAQYNKSLDRYEIRKVMGPDEFHDGYPDAAEPGIDNNAYTNVMVVWVLCRAMEVLDMLPYDRKKAIWNKLALRKEELELWDDISRKIRIVFHDDGIISQFEHYNDLKEFDWEGHKEKYGNIHRLDRILEAEGDTPNRYKVSKQADVLMLFYLLSADQLFELFERLGYPFKYETIPKNIEYYVRRTSHGSTLSRIVHSWVLSRSKRDLSWHLFCDALESDVSDIQGGTTHEGVHLGAMAGTVDLVQRCYTGMETRGNVLWFNPHLPGKLKKIEFNIIYRRRLISVKVTSDLLRISCRKQDIAPIQIGFRDKVTDLKPGDTLEFRLSDHN